MYEGEVISGDPNPDLESLNRKGIQKLYALIDSLEAKSEPDMVEIELWVNAKGYEEDYQVSNLGNIRSKNWKRTGRTQNIKPSINDGYAVVHLHKNGVSKIESVHRLVAESFIANPDKKPHINHINGDRRDNRVENLEWCTNSENMLHKYRVLGYKNRTSKPVICIETGKYYESQSDAARAFGRKGWQGASIRIAIEKNWKAFGYSWRYAAKGEKQNVW